MGTNIRVGKVEVAEGGQTLGGARLKLLRGTNIGWGKVEVAEGDKYWVGEG